MTTFLQKKWGKMNILIKKMKKKKEENSMTRAI